MPILEHPLIIAELCQNHNGSREILKRMVHAAAEAGADFVKIQSIRSRELTHRPQFEEGRYDTEGVLVAIRRPYAAERARLSRLDLSREDELFFVEECHRAGIAPMTTVFTRAVARETRDIGFAAVKVASYDCASFPLLKDLAEWWSTLFVSTGATHDEEIEQAAQALRGKVFFFLHCTTIYPTPLAELHLRRMDRLRRFTPYVGFSDHTRAADTGLFASKLALALGADCVERHFTVLDAGETRDGPVSIDPSQLAELVWFARLPRAERMRRVRSEFPDWEQGLGVSTRPLSAEELLNRDYYRGRFASSLAGRHIDNWEDIEWT